jgi:hypothetical protein
MKNEFMLLVRNRHDRFASFSSEKNDEFLDACKVYVEMLKKDGKLKAAQPLVREGRMISGSKGNWQDGPFAEGDEVIVGYYHVLATDLAEAIEIARGNPEFAYTSTARVEVRPIKTVEQSNQFVYPDKH